ncbi:DNA packaging protein UL32 [Canid alphaherpesvirus 1]|uniref:Packaging protein UL32 n=1 Tax=Canid alphaherpesvirus 1 TaxID=170325 RepID=A0A172ESJ0_9ALPH|nr:DNA packaging protein UL32 [Canid alphaherpesvirus 1]ALL25902.1 DNA packaging protein UL32 [Canid alphaherpesvirus 1]ALL25982.1 DNA packaging protein UL32 [Canid alphaherpesvirus 1]ALL26058.1 DNA packaging protein UL32 [Canid alphaherpesvirus 1]AQX83339.1 DNA packaging protein UL32 [Canid alphaherpesvirus 1]ARE29830.1 DNA packaging protein UL32 [Canid alphaherpesvirus 1]
MAKLLIADEITWTENAFLSPYMSFDPYLLTTNDTLCNEIIFASHLIQNINQPSPDEEEMNNGTNECINTPINQDTSLFVETMADCLALDRPCMVCRIINLYNKQFGLIPKWICDYVMLCSKSLASPLCSISVFIVSFEFVYLMDKYYLKDHNVTMVGSFARRVLNIIDIQRHFFLNGCFRTDGGLPSNSSTYLQKMTPINKVQFSNYSFLIQSITKALLLTLTDSNLTSKENLKNREQSSIGIKNQSLSTALVNWKDCAKLIDCSSVCNKKNGSPYCCTRAVLQDEEYEKSILNDKKGKNYGYIDLIFLLLSDIYTWNFNDKIKKAAEMRVKCVQSYWTLYKEQLFVDTSPKFASSVTNTSSPEINLGPVLLTTLKHSLCKNKTNSECVLCNLLIIKDYWLALRQFKKSILAHSANNASLFDCIPPILELWKNNNKTLDDGNRFIILMTAIGTEAIYKHFFCDPLCAISELQTNPRLLFDHPSSDLRDLELYKAQLATRNKFECRICAGLSILAYTFKTYQVFPPKPTIGAAFIKDAGIILRRHNLSLIALEHTLCNYV